MIAPAVVREIYLDSEKVVTIEDQVFFQNGDDGVHQWESGIVLARYLVQADVKGKVLELGSGSGLVGIALAKFTQATATMSDFNARVLENIARNVERNQVRVQVTPLDWRDPSTYQQPQDFVVGSDLIYDGAPLEALADTFLAHLGEDGIGFIVMPDKRKMTMPFLQVAESKGMVWTAEELNGWLTSSPHIDVSKGFRDFAELTMRKYMLYTLRRQTN